jgi:hypothetical protein
VRAKAIRLMVTYTAAAMILCVGTVVLIGVVQGSSWRDLFIASGSLVFIFFLCALIEVAVVGSLYSSDA